METAQKKKFFYGWVVVGCLFLIAMFPMVFYSNFYSFYQLPITQEFDTTYAQFSVSIIASTLATIIFGITLAGRLAKGNTRLFMLVGGVVASAAMFAQSLITEFWHIYVTFFVGNFALSAMTWIPINFLISQWFVDRKAFITSIVLTGSGLGGVLFSNLAAGVIANSGWRVGFQMTALITLATTVVVFLFLRKSPADVGQQPYVEPEGKKKAQEQTTTAPQWEGISKTDAMKTSTFWLYAFAAICCGIVAAGIFTQVPTYLTENNVNFATSMAILSGAGIVGRLVMGPIIDKVGLGKGTMLTSVIAIGAVILLALVPQFGAMSANLSMAIFPFGSTITTLATPLLTGILFGYKDFGGIYGLGNTFFTGGCMIGPLVTAGIRTITGSYTAAWFVIIGVLALLALSVNVAITSGKKLQEVSVNKEAST